MCRHCSYSDIPAATIAATIAAADGLIDSPYASTMPAPTGLSAWWKRSRGGGQQGPDIHRNKAGAAAFLH